jgi:hypothetical protein
MSDEPECEFSSAMLMISHVRNRLGDDIIDVSECAASRFQQGLNLGAMGPDIVLM